MMEEECLGAYNFNVLRSILETLNLITHGVGVEVGVFDGGTSLYLLNSFPQLKLLSIDPYKSYDEYDQNRLDQAKATALARLNRFGERSARIYRDSVEAAEQLPDDCFDFVFIDGDHGYEAVTKDIQAWYPKVRSGGLFCGHDYRWEGVTKAVNEFSALHNLHGRFSPKESDIWWFLKPLGH